MTAGGLMADSVTQSGHAFDQKTCASMILLKSSPQFGHIRTAAVLVALFSLAALRRPAAFSLGQLWAVGESRCRSRPISQITKDWTPIPRYGIPSSFPEQHTSDML